MKQVMLSVELSVTVPSCADRKAADADIDGGQSNVRVACHTHSLCGLRAMSLDSDERTRIAPSASAPKCTVTKVNRAPDAHE